MKPLVIVFLFIGLMGCSESLPKKQLQEYVIDTENGLHFVQENGGYVVEVIYRPKDLIIEQQIGARSWSELEVELDSLDYFVVKLSKDHLSIENRYASNPIDFNRVLGYMTTEITKDVFLKVGELRVDPVDMLFAHAMGTSESSDFLFVFKSDLLRVNKDFSFVFDGAQLGMSRYVFDYDIEKLKDIPRLKL